MTSKIVQEDLSKIINTNLPWDKFAAKVVLVTGANGFLPAYMIYTLLNLNQKIPYFNVKVIALVRNIEKARLKFTDHLNNENLVFLEQDVCDEIKIDKDQNIDFIIHAASQASPKYYGTDPVGTLSANILGTINTLNLAYEKRVESYLYFSSGEVYGEVKDEFNPIKENQYGYLDQMQVRACYGESKRMGENICVSYHHQYNVPVKVVRPFHTYGPGMQLNDGRVYADFVADIVNGRNIEMKSDGAARRAFCYLTDATIAFFLVLLKGESAQAYNVGNPYQEHSIIELAETLADISVKPLKVIRKATQNNTTYLKSPIARNTPNIEKLSALGWHPEVAIIDGFKRTIESYSVK